MGENPSNLEYKVYGGIKKNGASGFSNFRFLGARGPKRTPPEGTLMNINKKDTGGRRSSLTNRGRGKKKFLE